MFCCAGQKSEASHSVKPSLVSMLNAKILYFWLEKDCASHSPQMIEPAALERESRRSQQTSMILSSALCKNRSMIYCHSFTTHFLWGHFFFFFSNHSREESACPCPLRGYTEEIGRVIPAIKVIFPLCPFQLTPSSPRSLSSHLVSSTHQDRKIPSK